MQHKVPEYLDVLNALVRVEGSGLAIKKNQTFVMKYIMQSYGRIAYILEKDLEFRYLNRIKLRMNIQKLISRNFFFNL